MTRSYAKTLIAATVAVLVGSPAIAADAGTSQSEAKAPILLAAGDTKHQGTGTTGAASQQLNRMTPNDLEGMKVVGTNGEEIGDVKQIVVSRTGNHQPHAVISVGGVAGIGDKEYVVPLTDLRLSGDRLQATGTKAQMQGKTEYMRDQYVEVSPDDQPISEFSAFETPREGMKTPREEMRDRSGAERSGSGSSMSPEEPRRSGTPQY